MRRRDFNRMALGLGLGSSLVAPAAAQDSAAKSKPTGGLASPTVISNTGRTYNNCICLGSTHKASGVSACTGPGTIPGKPIAT
jgi:hypothetical protein